MLSIQVLAVVTIFYLVFEISERNMLSLARFEIFTALWVNIVLRYDAVLIRI